MRARWKILIGSLVVIVILLLGVGILVLSPAGLSLARFVAEKAGVQIETTEGQLANHFTLKGIRAGEGETALSVERISVNWSPSSLLRGTLHLKDVEVEGLYKKIGTKTEDKDKTPAKPLSLSPLPLQIRIDRFAGKDIFFDRGLDKKGHPNTSFQFKSILVAAEVGPNGANFTTLTLDGPDMGINWKGRVEQQEGNWEIDLGGTFHFAGFGFKAMSGRLALQGALETPDVYAELFTPGSIQLTGQLFDLFGSPTWKAKLIASDFDLSAWINHCPQIVVSSADAEMTGDFGHYEGHADFHGEWGKFNKLHLVGDLNGNAKFIDFARLSLAREKSLVIADNSWISWEKIFDWRASVVATDVDPSLFSESLVGRLDARFQTTGEVFKEDLEGLFDIAELKGELHGQPLIAKGDLKLHQEWIGTEKFELRSGEVDGVAILGPARVSWGQEPGWSAEVLFQHFNPSFFNPELAGKIDGTLASSGHFPSDTKGLEASLKIKSLSGSFRGKKLEGSGEFSYFDNVISSPGMHISLGRSNLRLGQGNASKEQKSDQISFTADLFSPDLAELLPKAGGSLKVNAEVNGLLKSPTIKMKLKGDGLHWQNFSVQNILGKADLQMTENGRIDASLKANAFHAGDTALEQARVTLRGKMSKHEITLQVDGADIGGTTFSTAINANGSYKPGEQSWSGLLRNGKINLPEIGNWHQLNGAKLIVNPDKLMLSDFTLSGDLGQVNLAASASLDKEKEWKWQGTLSLQDVSLDRLNRVQKIPVDLQGVIGASFNVSGVGATPLIGKFNVDLPELKIDLKNFAPESDTIVFTGTTFVGNLRDGVFSVRGQSSEGGGGLFHCNISLAGLNSTSSLQMSPIRGAISLRDFNIAILGDFLDYGQPYGKVTTDLQLDGTLMDPVIIGGLKLDGGVGILSQGISLNQVNLKVDVDNEGLVLDGRAHSGKGYIDISGNFRYKESSAFSELKITGKNFLAVDQPEYSFVVNPDMKFAFNRKEGHLTGSVDVVSGSIEPENLTSSVSPSGDVVIVGNEKNKGADWLFYLGLDVNLGDDVKINGYGVSGKVAGKLKVKMAPEEMMTGVGTLKLKDGKFAVYGRTLDIIRGNVIFSGGPIGNPGVDVRAQKALTNEQAKGDGYTVGVDISGLVQDLQFHLFSDPSMTETEILSYMVLGHSQSSGDSGDASLLATVADQLGVAGGSNLLGGLKNILSLDDVYLDGSAGDKNISVVVGKHLTDDLYVGYDVNVYSQVGEFRVRYDLSRGFWVETFSSSESTGADLLYTFEK